MATSVRLDDRFVQDVKACAPAQNRSVPRQIEHWAKIGRLVEENPDLSYATIREMQQASTEVQAGLVSRYERQTARASEVVDPERQAMLQLLASAEEDVAAGRVFSSSELLARLSARAAAHR